MSTPDIFPPRPQISPQQRATLLAQTPVTVWLTGLSGAGKSTLAGELDHALWTQGRPSYVLDGDALRHGLNNNLGFSPEDRAENIRRVAEVARLMNNAGLIVICALISPLRVDREIARNIIGADKFLEVHISTSLATCEKRDTKGLYLRARQGSLAQFTGVSAPYEEPLAPAARVDTTGRSIAAALQQLLDVLRPFLAPKG